MNFLFSDDRGNRYIGTAGHCVIDQGLSTWSRGEGPVASDFDGNRIGEFLFAVAIMDEELDLALARLDPGVKASPKMCEFQGPTGINTETPAFEPVLLNFFGHGQLISEGLPARSAVANGMPSKRHVYALGPGFLGDSGSGVLSEDGRAVGILSTGGLHTKDPQFPQTGHLGTIGIVRLKPQIQLAERELLVDLKLKTIKGSRP
jgi:hypothetical protein